MEQKVTVDHNVFYGKAIEGATNQEEVQTEQDQAVKATIETEVTDEFK